MPHRFHLVLRACTVADRGRASAGTSRRLVCCVACRRRRRAGCSEAWGGGGRGRDRGDREGRPARLGGGRRALPSLRPARGRRRRRERGGKRARTPRDLELKLYLSVSLRIRVLPVTLAREAAP